MKTSIRLIVNRDIPEVLDIYNYYIECTTISFETRRLTLAEFSKRIKAISNFYPWLVYEQNNEILGYAYATSHRERSAYKWSVDVAIYLKNTEQSKGIGQQLYRKLFTILKRQGFYNAYGGITLPNIKSVALHEIFNFKKIAEYNKVGFKNNKWWNVGWWELELNNNRENPQEPKGISTLKVDE